MSARPLGMLGAAAISLSLLGGCASTGKSAGQQLDPWENWNRKVFGFNEVLDENLLVPVATAYKNVVPELVRQGIHNVFNNVYDAWSAVNHVLQGKIESGLNGMMRVGVNTAFGLGGLLDPASEMGLVLDSEDFGQTLGYWGIGQGAYIVWPLLGPSSVRETVALPLDRLATPAFVLDGGGAKIAISTLQLVSIRARLLDAGKLLDDIALDKYSFVRDAYLARRRSLVYDGDPPPEPERADPQEAPADRSGGAASPSGAASAPAR